MLILIFLLILLQDKEPRGIIPLENLSVQKVDDPKKPVGVSEVASGQNSCRNFQNRVQGEGGWAGLSRRRGHACDTSQ